MRDTLYRRLQPFRHLHDCSGCFRLERWPGGTCTHWKSAALPRRTPEADFGRYWFDACDDRLRQPNVLSVSASWRYYLGNLGSRGGLSPWNMIGQFDACVAALGLR